MLLYSLIIIFFQIVIVLLNILFNPMALPWWQYIIYTVVATLFVIIVDGIFAFIIRRLPNKWFDYHHKCFQVSKRKIRFFDHLNVKKWKDHVPELGGFTNFHKNKIADPHSSEYMGRFILEACYGIVIHYWSVPFGFLILLMDYRMYISNSNLWLTIFLPVALANAPLILAPAFILEYNLPKLVRIYEINLKRQSK